MYVSNYNLSLFLSLSLTLSLSLSLSISSYSYSFYYFFLLSLLSLFSSFLLISAPLIFLPSTFLLIFAFFSLSYLPLFSFPVGWDCRIHQLLLCRRVNPTHQYPGYDPKQSDSEVPVILRLWGMRSTPSLPFLPGPLWPGIVAPDRALLWVK